LDYQASSVYDLLTAAARGRVGVDRRWLHAILDRGAEAVPDLLRFASEDFRSLPINCEEDLIHIFRYLKTPEAIPFLIDVIRFDPIDVPDDLVDTLVVFGEAALEPLLSLYGSLEEDVAGETAFVLAALRIRDPRVLAILEDRLEYDATEGAIALGLYGDPAAIPAIERILAEIPASETALRHELERTIETLRAEPEETPDAPFDIWDLYPEEARPDVGALPESDRLELLSSPSAAIRLDAAHSFFNREFSTEARARLLEIARGDEDGNVRGRAWEALLEAADEAEVRKSMLAVIDNPDAPLIEKGGAIVGLSQDSANPRVRAAMESLYSVPEVRSKALEAMWRSLDRTFAPYFPKHLDDPDSDVQRQAIWGVGYLGIHAEAKRLERFFDDEDLRSDALFAYALSVPAEVSRGRIPPLYRKINTLSGGLSEGEAELVRLALDERLIMHGLKPVFFGEEAEEEPEPPASVEKAGRNDPCPCGSGKKYKKCCGAPV
jgi:HEAT repeat protein